MLAPSACTRPLEQLTKKIADNFRFVEAARTTVHFRKLPLHSQKCKNKHACQRRVWSFIFLTSGQWHVIDHALHSFTETNLTNPVKRSQTVQEDVSKGCFIDQKFKTPLTH